MLNLAAIASDAGVPAATVREYYFVLEDTLVGFLVPAWIKSRRRKAIATAKFYFFDTGVSHALAGTESLDRNSDLYGRSFEHWVAMELRAYLSYRRRPDNLCYWRSTAQHEVDFVVGDHTPIEVKATRHVTPRDLRGLQAIAEERKFRRLLCVSEDRTPTTRAQVRCIPWQTFAEELWSDRLLS